MSVCCIFFLTGQGLYIGCYPLGAALDIEVDMETDSNFLPMEGTYKNCRQFCVDNSMKFAGENILFDTDKIPDGWGLWNPWWF